ncbi:MAG: hypothetical protein OXH77_10500 [Anaerolineaceae bacterium]|nr:hypothetical protein [Anaerolineaceae bacterium]
MIASGLERQRSFAAERGAVSLRLSPALAGLLTLFAVGLILRLAELDRIPLGEGEARQALAALDLLNPRGAVGRPAVESPTLLAAQALLFGLFGSSEVTARLPVAMAGALLPFAALALRSVLGQGRSVALCLLLAASPILLMASRQSAPIVLSLLLLASALWGAQRYRQTGEQAAATCAMASTLVLTLLAEAGGAVLAMQVGLALLLTWWSRHRGREWRVNLVLLRRWSLRWPYVQSMPPALLVFFLVATLFMWYPAGLAATGDLLQATLTGLVTPGSAATVSPTTDLTVVTPRLAEFLARLQLVVAFEPLLVAAAGGYLLLRRASGLNDADRFFVFWLLTGTLSLFLWRAAGPAHVLWLILPLAGLSAGLLPELQAKNEARRALPLWGVTLVAGVSLTMLAMIAFYTRLLLQGSPQLLHGLAGLALMPLFLLARAWRRPWPILLRATLIGVVLLVLPLSLGGGWATMVSRSEEADGLWRRSATSQNVWLLQDSLRALADRESGGFPGLELALLKDGTSLPRWLVRDHINIHLVDRVEDLGDAGVLLLPGGIALPDGAGAWIGQDFTISRHVSAANGARTARNFLAADSGSGTKTTYVLWLRQEPLAESRDDGDGR